MIFREDKGTGVDLKAILEQIANERVPNEDQI